MPLAEQDLHTLQDGFLALQQQVLVLQTQATLGDGILLGDGLDTGGGVQDTGAQSTAVWVLCCAALVCFMQAGFALVEAGTCRAKNALSILVKNQVDFLCAGIAWFLFGWGLAFGDALPTAGLAGTTEFFGGAVMDGAEVSDQAIRFHFQQMFCAVAATIVSGGIAERAHLRGYILYSFIMTSFIYPCVACWCWNSNGWLASRGFADFAGAGVVHLTGGMGALSGAWVLGPRIGRFGTGGISQDCHEFSPHNVPFIAVGTMILQFGWYGFNAGSTLSMGTSADARTASLAAINTTMAAVAGGLGASATCMLKKRRWDVPYVCNGILAGCVSITAACAYVSPWSALIIGALGSLGFGLAYSALHRLRIDDPISAFPVHGVCGFWGLVAVAAFHRSEGVLGEPVEGPELWVQVVGGLSISAFSAAVSLFAFMAMRRVGMMSSSQQDQRRGLDRSFSLEAYNSGEVSRYHAFISHAKNSHGATARWLQLELAHYAKGRSRIFLDSDNLINLNHLLATVRDSVDVLVVLATEELWWRPWCAGEIAIACSADVPVVLVMMGTADQPLRLDFGEISRRVREKIPREAMDTLAPFGIGYGDIELAYSRLAAMPQVPFGLLGRRGVRDAIAAVARHAGLRRGGRPELCASPWARTWTETEASPAGGLPVARGWMMRQASPNYIIVGDPSNLEAVAAMHICERALVQASDQDSDFRVATCADMSEARVLALVGAGATIILVLSRGVLECPLVQRCCLARARALWPDGFAGSYDAGRASLAVTIDADHLGFEFPCPSFYDGLQASLGRARRDRGESADQVGGSARIGRAATLVTGDARDATLTTTFFRLLFQQIALPLSTHGSWKAIQQQICTVYERAVQVPRVLGGDRQLAGRAPFRKAKTEVIFRKETLRTLLRPRKGTSFSSQSGKAMHASLPSPSAHHTYSDASVGSGAEADEEEVAAPEEHDIECP